MNKLFLLPAFLLVIMSCSSTKSVPPTIIDMHNSQNALDWEGTYRGILPCADCEGIQTTIQLNTDQTFTLQSRYLGKSDSVFTITGRFTWSNDGSQITLNGSLPDEKFRYQVGELNLVQLDLEGNKVTGALADHYVLSKPAFELYERYWKLVAVNGHPFVADSNYRKEPHLIFKEKDNRVTGNDGCNSFFGAFDLAGFNHIQISNVGSTLMACPDLGAAAPLKDALQKVNQFQIDGDTLLLSQNGTVPLAKFVSVVMN